MSKLDLLKGTLRFQRAQDHPVEQALRALREHLGMDIAYLAEFLGDKLVFRVVDAPGHNDFAAVGDAPALDGQWLGRMGADAVSELIPKFSDLAPFQTHVTAAHMRFGSGISVPIRRMDGTLYGVLCCLSVRPDSTLNHRDLEIAEVFAAIVEKDVQKQLDLFGPSDHLRALIAGMIETMAFTIHAQPIVMLADSEVTGYEALCRFPETIGRDAEAVFETADRVRLRSELEKTVIRAITGHLPSVPDPAYLSLNASPATVFSAHFSDLFDGLPLERLVLELTEHQEVEDYPALLRALYPLREAGLRIAVDDAGRGYSGLHQILRLKPDLIKLDRALVQGIDSDRAKSAMCAAMVHYASESGAILVAEGIETTAEAAYLRKLGVPCGQGYHFGRPVPLSGLSAVSAP